MNTREEAFFSIVSCEILIWDELESELQRCKTPVTVARLAPLHYLVSEPMRLQDLTERMHAKPSAASRLVERMVRDGLIDKRADESDGRAVLLHATDEGMRVEAAGRKAFERCAREVFGDLSEGELQTLCNLLGRVRRMADGTDA